MSNKAQVEKDKGNEAFKAGDFPKAIGHYTAAFIADPSNPTYPLNRAAAYLKLGKNEDAERDCDAVLRLDSKNVKGHFRRGQARVALQKLHEAETDFSAALKLDPANQAARQELKKTQDALKATPPKSKQPQTLPATSPPKRRRIPIQIIEPDSSAAKSGPIASTSKPVDDSLFTPVSSRVLSPLPSQTPSVLAPADTSSPSTSAPPRPPPPQTFREARAAREETRYRGGIFKADGTQTLYKSPTQAEQNGNASAPKREPPQTLVAFKSLWSSLTTEEERWDVLRQIPAARLPVLFKTSLDASTLAAILHSLRVALSGSPGDAERLKVVRAYMVNMPRVPRFGTVSLMMSSEELADAQAVWDMLGRYQGDGVEGQMEKRKEDGSKSAWGCT
ncbi:hypothetical protein VTO73DRAFT_5254 [Trametes versicolor]